MEDYNSEMDQNFDDEKVLSHNDSSSRFESQKSSSNAMGSLILNESSNNEGFKLSSGTTETKENESKKTLNNEEKKFYHVENLSLKEPIKNYVFTETKKSINHTFDPEVRVHGDETEIKYSPQMPDFERIHFLDELGKEAYDRIKEVRDSIESEYPLQLEVHIEDIEHLCFYHGNIYEGKPFANYVYYGCIDLQEYEKTKVIIFHGPGSLLMSNGLLREGIFQGGQL